MEQLQPKTIWKSKTLWFNAVTFVVAGAGVIIADPSYGPELTKWAAIVLALGNVGLRTITTGPVTLKKQKAPPQPDDEADE